MSDMCLSIVAESGFLSDFELREFVHGALSGEDLDGRSVLFIIPDQTRSMPMPLLFRALHEAVAHRASRMDFLIALGTHPPMSDAMIETLLGITPEERYGPYGEVDIFNHEWQNPAMLASLGTVGEGEIAELSGGLMRQSAEVLINKRVLDYDLVCIVGPVFPHEVVGFSGGNKYFFPGVAGEEILHLFHWLGALITNPVINGTKHTPVRAVIDRAAAMIPVEKRCFCLNVSGKSSRGIFYGSPEEAWSEAADLAAQTHVVYLDRPYDSVLAVAPLMYDEIWVAGKCMYKLEPIVADGGELIIYAPHVHEVSVTHGRLIREIGYHTRDYFLAQMGRFRHIPPGILAHSTHVRGLGTYRDGVERCRVDVTLATGIPEEECRALSLGYRDPASIDPEAWRNGDPGRLLVENAGETLYRLREGNPVPEPIG
jgi:lactate racemase